MSEPQITQPPPLEDTILARQVTCRKCLKPIFMAAIPRIKTLVAFRPDPEIVGQPRVNGKPSPAAVGLYLISDFGREHLHAEPITYDTPQERLFGVHKLFKRHSCDDTD